LVFLSTGFAAASAYYLKKILDPASLTFQLLKNFKPAGPPTRYSCSQGDPKKQIVHASTMSYERRPTVDDPVQPEQVLHGYKPLV